MKFAKSWNRAWSGLSSLHNDQNLFKSICSHYTESTRQYHTLQHLGECIDLFESVMDLAIHPAEVEMALWFHDAIYNTTSQGNEAQSAQWAKTELSKAGVLSEKIDRIYSLIMATCHTTLPKTIDECLLVDIDLAILGSSTERFADYEQQSALSTTLSQSQYLTRSARKYYRAFWIDRQFTAPNIFRISWNCGHEIISGDR